MPPNMQAAYGGQCTLNLQIEEDRGYSSRSTANRRNALYLRLLHADLSENAFQHERERARTLYYLGLHYMSSFENTVDRGTDEAQMFLARAQDYFEQRAQIVTCNP